MLAEVEGHFESSLESVLKCVVLLDQIVVMDPTRKISTEYITIRVERKEGDLLLIIAQGLRNRILNTSL